MNKKDNFMIIANKLAEYAAVTPFGSVSVEMTMHDGEIAKIKFLSEIRNMQFLNLDDSKQGCKEGV